jgi:hypothetical protein
MVKCRGDKALLQQKIQTLESQLHTAESDCAKVSRKYEQLIYKFQSSKGAGGDMWISSSCLDFDDNNGEQDKDSSPSAGQQEEQESATAGGGRGEGGQSSKY